MEISELKKLTLSNLALIMLNKNLSEDLRFYAELEFKIRCRNMGVTPEDFCGVGRSFYQETEGDKIIKRGFDINNYLFKPNPNMQELMEAYYTNYYGEKNRLLMSEKHLCNEADFMAKFFSRICALEKGTLKRRIVSSTNPDDKKMLQTYLDALDLRTKQMRDEKKEADFLNRIEFNEAFEVIDEHIPLEIGNNLTLEQTYRILKSKTKTRVAGVLELLNDSILDPDICQDVYGLYKTVQDSSKLRSQKLQLLRQARQGFEVNYSSPQMRLTYPKVLEETRK